MEFSMWPSHLVTTKKGKKVQDGSKVTTAFGRYLSSKEEIHTSMDDGWVAKSTQVED